MTDDYSIKFIQESYINHSEALNKKLASKYSTKSEVEQFVSQSILTKLANTTRSISRLVHGIADSECVDAIVLFRVVYDLHIQALFIFEKDTLDRAILFANYACIERYNVFAILSKYPNKIILKLQSSPNWLAECAELQKMYDKYKGDYLTSTGNVRKQWYKGSLDDLASEIGRTSEYKFIQKITSSIVHSSSITMQNVKYNQIFSNESIQLYSLFFMYRVLVKLCDYYAVNLSDAEQSLRKIADETFL